MQAVEEMMPIPGGFSKDYVYLDFHSKTKKILWHQELQGDKFEMGHSSICPHEAMQLRERLLEL